MKLIQLQEAKYKGPEYDFETVMAPVIQYAYQRLREEGADPSDGDLVGDIISAVSRYMWDEIGE